MADETGMGGVLDEACLYNANNQAMGTETLIKACGKRIERSRRKHPI